MLESMKIEIAYYWYINHINKHVMFDYHIFISIDKFLCKSSILIQMPFFYLKLSTHTLFLPSLKLEQRDKSLLRET